MTNDWTQLEQIFQTAVELEGTERSRYIADACRDCKWLLDEVNSLLTSFDTSSAFIEEPVLDLGFKVLDGDAEFEPGKVIGHYEIKKKIGEGGMGDVYYAHDKQLDRPVALKFLTAPFLDNNRARRLMLREARAAAMLDHRNICRIYGVEEIDGRCFIVMQYVEGKSLSALIRENAVPAERVLPIALEIAGALNAAHSQGIIHRDIKPGNIMMTNEDEIKVLDFGLAKVVLENVDPQNSDSQHSLASQSGLIQGTVGYMSPEQLKAESLDFRSDIFSYGTLLFQLATGTNPFLRGSDAETIAEILSPGSPMDKEVANGVPKRLRRVIRRCMEKEKHRRYGSMDEVIAGLDGRDRSKHVLSSVQPWVFGAILLLLAAATAGLLYLQSNKIHKAAVIPFVNDTADPTLDYLSDGLTEGLIAKLSDNEKVKVSPYTVVAGYRGNNVDDITAGREIGADIIIAGRLSREEDHLLVQTNLVDIDRAVTIQNWEDRFETSEVLSVKDLIAERFRTALAIDESERAATRHRGSDTASNEAFSQYIRGRYLWRRRDPQNLRMAIAAFQKAIELDPGYSRPYAGLADSYVLMTLAGYGSEPTRETMSRAKAAARQALEIDPQNAEALTSLGVVLTKYDWNWQEAEKQFRQAIESDPKYSAAHYWLSDLLAVTGRADESINEAQTARDLDPFSQQTSVNLARTFYYARQYDQAMDILLAISHDERPDSKIRYMMGLIYLQKKMYPEALRVFQEIAEENRSFAAAVLGYTFAKMGNRREAGRVIEELKNSTGGGRIPYDEILFVYVALGDNENAISCLNETYKDRHAVMIALKVEPLFDPIRSDKRFEEILAKMSLS